MNLYLSNIAFSITHYILLIEANYRSLLLTQHVLFLIHHSHRPPRLPYPLNRRLLLLLLFLFFLILCEEPVLLCLFFKFHLFIRHRIFIILRLILFIFRVVRTQAVLMKDLIIFYLRVVFFIWRRRRYVWAGSRLLLDRMKKIFEKVRVWVGLKVCMKFRKAARASK